MKKIIVLIITLITLNAPQLRAYIVCNKSQIPITVIVCQTQDKAVESLRSMGWSGQFPRNNQTLRLSSGTFKPPAIFVALHWATEPGKCDGTNWRDLQKNLDQKYLTIPSFYFMIFESFDKTGSTAIHFLTSGSFSLDSTINFAGSHTQGWIAKGR